MQVFQRLTLATDLPSEEKSAMTNTLAQGVWQAQQNLHPAIPPMNPWSVSMENSYDPSVRKLPGLNFPLSNGDLHDPSVQRPHISTQPDVINTMALLEQYSDKLLSLVEQKISSSHEKPKN
ncbi:hypothetical protein X975_14109, partial [Stegodyphus mimosarum]